jgi:uncharacterized membrane protein YfcA
MTRRTALIPLWLLAGVLVVGGAVGWGVLEWTGSTVVMGVVAAVVTWGGIYAARRVWAARGSGPSFDELPSMNVEADGTPRLVGLTLAFVAFLAGVVGAMALLYALGMDGPEALGVEPAHLLAFVLAVPLWRDVDARLAVRAARTRAGG